MKKRKAILSKHFTLTVPPNINFYLSFKKIKIKNRNFRNSPLCYLQNQLVPRATTGPKSGPSVPKTAKRHPLHTTRYQVSVHLHFSKSQKSYEKVLKPFDFRTFSGPSDWIRTSGLLNPIQARYQTSPHPDKTIENTGFLSGSLLIFSSVTRLIFTFSVYHQRAEKSTFSALFLRPHKLMSLTRR